VAAVGVRHRRILTPWFPWEGEGMFNLDRDSDLPGDLEALAPGDPSPGDRVSGHGGPW